MSVSLHQGDHLSKLVHTMHASIKLQKVLKTRHTTEHAYTQANYALPISQCTPQSNHRRFRKLDTHIKHTHEQAYITLYPLSQTFARNALLNLITKSSETSTHTYRTHTQASLGHALPPFPNLRTQCTPQSNQRKFRKLDTHIENVYVHKASLGHVLPSIYTPVTRDTDHTYDTAAYVRAINLCAKKRNITLIIYYVHTFLCEGVTW